MVFWFWNIWKIESPRVFKYPELAGFFFVLILFLNKPRTHSSLILKCLKSCNWRLLNKRKIPTHWLGFPQLDASFILYILQFLTNCKPAPKELWICMQLMGTCGVDTSCEAKLKGFFFFFFFFSSGTRLSTFVYWNTCLAGHRWCHIEAIS